MVEFTPPSRPPLQELLRSIAGRKRRDTNRLVIEDFEGLMGGPSGGGTKSLPEHGDEEAINELAIYLYQTEQNLIALNEGIEALEAMPGGGPGGGPGPEGPPGGEGPPGVEGPTGPPGVSVTSFDRVGDTVTITFSDGSTDTFTVSDGTDGTDGGPGPAGTDGTDGGPGPAGMDGATISNIATEADGDIVVTFSDGQEFTIPAGQAGRGIDSIERAGDTVTVTYDDGSPADTFMVMDGVDGTVGETGPPGAMGGPGIMGGPGPAGQAGDDAASAQRYYPWTFGLLYDNRNENSAVSSTGGAWIAEVEVEGRSFRHTPANDVQLVA